MFRRRTAVASVCPPPNTACSALIGSRQERAVPNCVRASGSISTFVDLFPKRILILLFNTQYNTTEDIIQYLSHAKNNVKQTTSPAVKS